MVIDDGLEKAEGRSYDIAIGTWWETAAALWRSMRARRAMLLQSFEQRFYDADAPFERLSAEATLSLPLDFVAVAPWIRDAAHGASAGGALVGRSSRDRQGDIRRRSRGQPRRPAQGPDRGPAHAVVQGCSGGGGGRGGDARAGDQPRSWLSTQMRRATWAWTGSWEASSRAGMAALYRESDVLVKLSRVSRASGWRRWRASTAGVPCVVTPYTGHEEYTRHGENALVVGFDDTPRHGGGARPARSRSRSAGERSRRARARPPRAGRAAEDSTRLLHEALVEISGRRPTRRRRRRCCSARSLLNTELGRARFNRRAGATEEALVAAEALVRELSTSRDECGEMLEETRAELARIRALARVPGGARRRSGRRAGRRR